MQAEIYGEMRFVRISVNQSAGRRNGPSILTDLAWRKFQRRQPGEVT